MWTSTTLDTFTELAMTKTWVHGLTDGRGTPIGAVPTGEGHRYTLYGLDESGDLGLSMECYIGT